jgi:hypothetical protein
MEINFKDFPRIATKTQTNVCRRGLDTKLFECDVMLLKDKFNLPDSGFLKFGICAFFAVECSRNRKC